MIANTSRYSFVEILLFSRLMCDYYIVEASPCHSCHLAIKLTTQGPHNQGMLSSVIESPTNLRI
jgi:hypothetical protein